MGGFDEKIRKQPFALESGFVSTRQRLQSPDFFIKSIHHPDDEKSKGSSLCLVRKNPDLLYYTLICQEQPVELSLIDVYHHQRSLTTKRQRKEGGVNSAFLLNVCVKWSLR